MKFYHPPSAFEKIFDKKQIRTTVATTKGEYGRSVFSEDDESKAIRLHQQIVKMKDNAGYVNITFSNSIHGLNLILS